jgi:hypothetical protein
VNVFGLAAPVNSGSTVDSDVGVAIAVVMFERDGVAVGAIKVAGRLMLNDKAHSWGLRP